MTEPTPAPVKPAAPQKKPWPRPPVWTLLLGGALLLIAAWIYIPSLFYQNTDDAAIEADTVTIVPKISAYVTALHVTDNSAFSAGDLLVELDPRDFLTARDNAAAQLSSASAAQATVQAQLDEQAQILASDTARIAGDQASLNYAEQELHRYAVLADNGAGTIEASQKMDSDFGVQRAALQADTAQLGAARAQLLVLRGQEEEAAAAVAQASAGLHQAQINLSYTKIYAPVSGTVANRTVQKGDFVQPGQNLFTAVPDAVYVIANFKETQLSAMRVGQTAEITVDAFPGLTLYGHIDSFQRGTGSYFALLPPENATGNFVKIIQRVPVKIVLDQSASASALLAPGMSVEVTVSVHSLPGWSTYLF